jgi:hypothetical protein
MPTWKVTVIPVLNFFTALIPNAIVMTVISICQFPVLTTTYLFIDDLPEEKMSDDELDDPRERLLKAHRCSKPSQGRTQGGCTGCTCIPPPPPPVHPPPAMCIPPLPSLKGW